jgi:hypothetical protein
MILAIDAAPAARPPKPNMAATIAITKKMRAYRNMICFVYVNFDFEIN